MRVLVALVACVLLAVVLVGAALRAEVMPFVTPAVPIGVVMFR